jgi:hypothetical protein
LIGNKLIACEEIEKLDDWKFCQEIQGIKLKRIYLDRRETYRGIDLIDDIIDIKQIKSLDLEAGDSFTFKELFISMSSINHDLRV